ncbi:hypothetical protein LCGC14_0396760 [marine sediment metagenome]|uniref:Uncharacterized protein n=1 Tax=marine sediment metagenome TaxID=412755 RepID=A0A0F9T3Y4_9ZZZZ
MKLLLINPKSKAQDALPIPPLGILYLAAYVRDIADVEVIDDNRERHRNLESRIRNADIIGLTGTTSQYSEACKLAELARKHNKMVIYGGSHASALPVESLEYMDKVVVGEGEVALRDILLDGGNKIARKPFIKDLDTLPFPARDLVPIKDYPTRELKRFEGAYTHMMTGRGCNSKCVFCSSPQMWKRPRLMSAKRVFAEMMEIYEKYGIKNIHFQDDTFTLSQKRVIELCHLIEGSGVDFKWSCQTRPDMVYGNLGLLEQMANAGCVQIEFGVESGDERLLKTARKGYTKEDIKAAFYLARQSGIKTYGFFIIGLPGETIITWLKSIWFALRLKTESVWTVLMPYPGTAVYNQVKVLDTDYSNWMYKKPIIKSGYLSPRMLSTMRYIADKITNGLFNKGTYAS